MPERKNRRERLLIDLPVQLGVASRLTLLWAATATVASLVAVLMHFFSDPSTSFLAHLTTSRNWAPSLIAFAVTLPIAMLDLIRFSHRFAGPVHRLRKELRGLVEGGDPPPLKFRKDDYWKEMADDFNAVADLIRQRASDPSSLADSETVVDLPVAGGEV